MQTVLHDARERFKKPCSAFITIITLAVLYSAVAFSQDATKADSRHAPDLRPA